MKAAILTLALFMLGGCANRAVIGDCTSGPSKYGQVELDDGGWLLYRCSEKVDD